MYNTPRTNSLLAVEPTVVAQQETELEALNTKWLGGTPKIGVERSHAPVRLSVHDNLSDVECLWRELQKIAATSAYSSFQWSEAWLKTVGQTLQVKPRVVVGYDEAGSAVFILPLQLRKRFGFTVMEFLGAPDMQFGYGLFAKAFLPVAAAWFEQNLPKVVALAGPAHVVALLDMPHEYEGHEHPLKRLFTVTCANDSYSLDLNDDFDTVYSRKRNSETRRANRRKDGRLMEQGEIKFLEPATPEELHAVIDVMLDHKVRRLAENGIHGVFNTDEHRMMHMLADAEENGRKLFSVRMLTLDGRILAITFGGRMNETYWFYVSSLAPDESVSKYSPGDYALRQTIQACCEGGLKAFDFGAGAAAYKVGWTDKVMHLRGIVQTNSFVGLPWVLAKVAKLQLTAMIKRNPALRTLAFDLRRMLRGRSAA